jgi:glycosyltransferase involved in cell wall biosynthesis
MWNDLDLQLVVCGTGFHLERLHSLVTQKKLEHRIHILGWVTNMDYVYNWCDVLIHLTKMDSFPNATMEAMMHEKPVITNEDSCGTREQIFDGLNGFVVKDADGFLKAIRSYSENPGLRISHGRAGKLLTEKKFSVSVQKQRMQEALDEFFPLFRSSK